MQKIKTIGDIQDIAQVEPLECFIALAGGMIRSSKTIFYYPELEQYEVTHEIDDTTELLSEKEMLENTNIGEALKVGALFAY